MKHVMAALDLSGTSFARAKTGAHFVKKYGEVASEVKEMLERQDAVPKGSAALLNLLQTWDIKHSDVPVALQGSNQSSSSAPPSQ